MPANPNFETTTTAGLPAAPDMHSRWAAVQTWWSGKNMEKARLAEARLLSRLQFFTYKSAGTTIDPAHSETSARIGLVHLSGKDRAMNTLIIKKRNPEPIVSSAVLTEAESNQNNGNEVMDDQGRTEQAQTKLDLTTDSDSMIDPPAVGERSVVITHGFGAGVSFFFRNFLALSQVPHQRVYAVDWLGMGLSSRPEFKFRHSSKTNVGDVVRQAEDFFVDALEEWRELQQIEKMTLVGHSLGGYLSTVYALKYPERVEKLILVSPVGIPENPDATQAPLPPAATKDGQQPPSPTPATNTPPTPGQLPRNPPSTLFRKLAMGAWERNITPQSIMRFTGPWGPSLVSMYVSRRFAHLEEVEQHDLNNYIYHISSKAGSGELSMSVILAPAAYARVPLMNRIKDLKMPTVFMYGEQDWMDWKAGEKARRMMSVPSVMMRIPEAGHHLYLDNPVAFNKALIQAITVPWHKSANSPSA